MIQIFPYKIPFKNTFKTSMGNFDFRDGILVCFTHQNHKYYSEISPLPGFSVSSLEICVQVLKKNAAIIDEILTGIINDIDDSFTFKSVLEIIKKSADLSNNWIKNELRSVLIPEINFAIDHIIFQVLVVHGNIHPKADLNLNIPINASAKSLDDAFKAEFSGIKTIKIKVGMNATHELSLIRNIREHLPNLKIRLDANGAWNFSESISFIKQVKSFNIEYIEQPLSTRELVLFGNELRSLGVPVAADESARSYLDVVTLIENKSADLLVIKPPMLGSFLNLLNIYDLALNSKLPCVFTSTLDSAINRQFAAVLCSALGSNNYAHGFGTGSLFEYDITFSNDEIQSGCVIVPLSGVSGDDINPNLIGSQI
jgi:o-succinylbenzoate synthase